MTSSTVHTLHANAENNEVKTAGASASATVATAQAGIAGTPLQVSASAPTASANAAIGFRSISAVAGAHVGEVTVGPFASRAGVKFGVEIGRKPADHIGPTIVPCSIM